MVICHGAGSAKESHFDFGRAARGLQRPGEQHDVEGVVGAFANDDRILAWDVWNEPSNGNSDAYGKIELKGKQSYVLTLLPQVFEWARSARPSHGKMRDSST